MFEEWRILSYDDGVSVSEFVLYLKENVVVKSEVWLVFKRIMQCWTIDGYEVVMIEYIVIQLLVL